MKRKPNELGRCQWKGGGKRAGVPLFWLQPHF